MTRRAPRADTAGDPRPRRRVAFYSHDTQGLGHIRRNIALAASLVTADPATDVLLLTGAPQATSLPLPPNTEIVTIPTVAKDPDGGYAAGAFTMPIESVVSLRASILRTALIAFAPDLVVIDKVARGLDGELESALRHLATITGHSSGVRPRLVLGLRDILDDPITAIRDWTDAQTTRAIRDHYDDVWVYGDRNVLDLAAEYDLPADVADKLHYTGYLAAGRDAGLIPPPDGLRPATAPKPYVLCMVGGGQDGYQTAHAFAGARYPKGHTGVIVTGPFMEADQRARLTDLADQRKDLIVQEFVTDSVALIAGAAAVVTMGGYNTVCEVLDADVPALVVPRVRPRREQLVRAERLAERGLLDYLHPTHVTTDRVGRWLRRTVKEVKAARRGDTIRRSRGSKVIHTPERLGHIRLDGLAHVPTLAAELLPSPPETSPTTRNAVQEVAS